MAIVMTLACLMTPTHCVLMPFDTQPATTSIPARGGHAQTVQPPPPKVHHLRDWICIHNHEGAWDDTGDPYWGGLQMDKGFMSSYGSDFIRRHHGGLANTWTPREQMLAAERAYKTRGFTPWPNTARMCGLL